jgi:hypothetical protein
MGASNIVQQVAPLLWTPWYATEIDDQTGIAWFWPIIQEVCELPDPNLMPRIERSWEPSELVLLRRYASVTRRLVDTTVFRGEGRASIGILSGTVEKVVPADDVTLGFASPLRQLFHHTEEASFDKARQVLARAAHQSGATEATDTLRLWKDAHGTLLNHDVHLLLGMMARGRGLETGNDQPGSNRPFVREEITPRDLIDTFLYGDQLHYGKGRELLERWRSDKAVAALMEVNMLADALMLAHFYAGFAGAVRVVLQAPSNSDK